MVEVVAAWLEDGERFLIFQRPKHKARGLLWEFVGGKVEAGEEKEAALIRECREELGVTVSVGEKLTEVVHEYPDLTIRLTLFRTRVTDGEITLLEHNDMRAITLDEIGRYDFCPADEPILAEMKRRREEER